MKKITVIVIALLLSRVGLSQNITFSELFGSDSSLLYGSLSITSYNDSIYFSMFDQDLSVSFQATTFIKTDQNGSQCAYNRFYGGAEYVFSASSLSVASEGYLIGGGFSGSLATHEASGTFFKFDRTNLDTIFVRQCSHGNVSGFNNFNELSDRSYLFSGQVIDSNTLNSTAWFLKTDSLGNVLWQKFLNSDVDNGPGKALPFQGGFYLPWGTYHRNTASGNPADSAIFVDKYDNNGNLIWRDTFGTVGYDNAPGPFVGIKEGGGVILVNILDITGSQSGPTVIYKFDTNGAILWHHYISQQTQLSSMTETRSGDIVACGWGGGTPIGISGDTVGRLGGNIMKFDRNGNLIFFQVYEFDTSQQDILNDITETADGGYACIGNAFEHIGNTNYQRAWLLKVDSNGCLNGDCPTIETGIKPIADLINFFVFPNPAATVFTVALAGPNDLGRYNDLHFKLYDLTGRLVLDQPLKEQTTLLHRDDLTSGMYLWQIADNNKTLRNGKLVLR